MAAAGKALSSTGTRAALLMMRSGDDEEYSCLSSAVVSAIILWRQKNTDGMKRYKIIIKYFNAFDQASLTPSSLLNRGCFPFLLVSWHLYLSARRANREMYALAREHVRNRASKRVFDFFATPLILLASSNQRRWQP